MRIYVLMLTFFVGHLSFASQRILDNAIKVTSTGKFSGRISSLSADAKLIRFKVDFDNLKYVNKFDEVYFWGIHQDRKKCAGKIIGKSSDYLLVKVPTFEVCDQRSNFVIGRYYNFFSRDLVNNLVMGRELVEILLKKRLALKGKMLNNQKLIDTYLQRIEALNTRYDVLRSKLEAEWREELAKMEGDHQDVLRNNEGLQIRLNEVQHKLEKYRVEDTNLSEDRWSLDPTLHFSR